MKIERLRNYDLIAHFEDAVRDKNYNPTRYDYNKSGFTYDELYAEIMRRISGELIDDDFDDDDDS